MYGVYAPAEQALTARAAPNAVSTAYGGSLNLNFEKSPLAIDRAKSTQAAILPAVMPPREFLSPLTTYPI